MCAQGMGHGRSDLAESERERLDAGIQERISNVRSVTGHAGE